MIRGIIVTENKYKVRFSFYQHSNCEMPFMVREMSEFLSGVKPLKSFKSFKS